jgi:hypothetical protein
VTSVETDDRTCQRYLTACHEAGHAVAALMRGEGDVVSITIEPTPDYLGYTHYRAKPCDWGFITYAGPWAEARAHWLMPDLDGEDDEGCIFADYLVGAWMYNNDGDGAAYRAAEDAEIAMLGEFGDQFAQLEGAREQVWWRELEDRWPVIQQVAGLLMAGTVTASMITDVFNRS